MPRRRRSPLRTLLGLLTVAGVVVAIGAGVVALRDYLTEEPVGLPTESATDPSPPTPLDARSMERMAPLSIRFDDVRIDDPIISVGLTDDGELEVPGETEVGWWEGGSSPGLPGATVLAAHVSWNGTIGPFNRLGNAELGEQLELDTGDGFVRTYQVVERALYDKDSLPAERIWRTTGPEMLVLITCGGSFNPSIHRYRQNIVVYAVPVAQRFADETDTSDPDSSVPDTTEDDDVSATGRTPVG